MIDWIVYAEDVACPVDDMRKMAFSTSGVRGSRGMVRRENDDAG
jgi:hypothetical protein